MELLKSTVVFVMYWSVYLSASAAFRARWFLSRMRMWVAALFVWPRAIVAGLVAGFRRMLRGKEGE